MSLSFKNPVFYLVLAAFFLLSVRPVYADGAVSPSVSIDSCRVSGMATANTAASGPYSSSDACLNYSLSVYGSGVYTVAGTNCTSSSCSVNVVGYGSASAVITFAWNSGQSCPVNSTGSPPSCVCGSGFIPDASGGSCISSPLTPAEQASAAAIAAAAANGSSVASQTAAGLAAAAAVNAGYTTAQAAVAGATAAAAISAGGTVLNAATAGHTAADQMAMGNTQQQAVALALAFSDADIANRAVAATLGTLPTYSDLAAATAAGLGAAAVGVIALGGAPITAALLASASIHAGIMAVVSAGGSSGQQSGAASAGVAAAVAGGSPLQVTLAPQVVAAALPSVPTQPQISAAALAAVSAFQTQPQSSWQVSPALPTNSATAAATAAAASIAAGGTSQAAAVAGAVAASVTASGGTVAAATAAAQAAAGVVAAGGTEAAAGVVGNQVGNSTDGATESTQKGVLSKLADLMNFGQGVVIADHPSASDRAGVASAGFTNGLSGLHQSAADSNGALEQSLLGAFSFQPLGVACHPFTGSVLARTVTVNICTYTEMLRSLLGWLFAVFGAYTIYQAIFRARA